MDKSEKNFVGICFLIFFLLGCTLGVGTMYVLEQDDYEQVNVCPPCVDHQEVDLQKCLDKVTEVENFKKKFFRTS